MHISNRLDGSSTIQKRKTGRGEMIRKPLHPFNIARLMIILASLLYSSSTYAGIDRGDAPDGVTGETALVWVFFSEKSGTPALRRDISERAVKRIRGRSAETASTPVVMQVREDYIEAVREYAERIRNVSNYFNAVSAEVKRSRISDMARLDFVKKIERVAVFRRKPFKGGEHETLRPLYGDPLYTRYGESLEQLEMVQGSDLLEEGINGSGESGDSGPVRICLLDSGFDLDHEAFQSLNLLAQYDFIQDDSITSNQEGDDPSQDRHGTVVLGAIAGYKEGTLLGPAWGAEYLLGKTEIVDREIIIEEDNWIAGLEWADSAGADIVSSSLGYYQWYEKEDMDGRTALCSRAAAKAASMGILVVTAVGNLGYQGDTTLIAPSDADSIIAVGGVYGTGSISYNSSRGPSADGRIKPEVVAMGVDVYSVDAGTYSGYARFGGTSLATPLVAGVCAQVLEVNPLISVIELRERIINTATRSSNPDNSYGYGIVQGADAAGIQLPQGQEDITIKFLGSNPFGDNVEFELYSPLWSELSVNIYDCRGRLVIKLMEYQVIKYQAELSWDGRDIYGRRVNAGIYFLSVFNSGELVAGRKLVFIP
ncbi:MAG: S8 family serine peptidase [Candidatus Latescibacteria bacterium]|nr:S8 family serine peptidase [bacterium]MBD3423889.1 S8 family serine peptidase [Candidatus Latescibacterota bacterium]